MSNRKIDDEGLRVALKAREGLADPDNWCINALRTDDGQRMCVRGHVLAVLAEREGIPIGMGTLSLLSMKLNEEEDTIFKRMGFERSLPDWIGWTQVHSNSAANFNNSHTHAEVLARFDEGIERMRQEALLEIVQLE